MLVSHLAGLDLHFQASPLLRRRHPAHAEHDQFTALPDRLPECVCGEGTEAGIILR